MYADRKELYKKIEEEYNGKVIAYITGDRNGFETKIASDVVDLFIEHLENIGPVKRIILYLYTRGGDVSAAWNIVNLIRMYCDELYVIVPHKAHSSGTIISLGANKIIMTKQATLSPIDPSLSSNLNPLIPEHLGKGTASVSVEAVNGFIELAKNEFKIDDVKTLGDILIKLADNVHPLVLGQAYRTRGQIKRIAAKLLKYQQLEDKQVEDITAFLCSDSGSHDYTINRKEASEELGLKVDKPTTEQYTVIKKLYDDFADELGLGTITNQSIVNESFSVKCGVVESIDAGSDYYAVEGCTSLMETPGGPKPFIRTSFEGWKHESDNLNPCVVDVITYNGEEIKYERDDNF